MPDNLTEADTARTDSENISSQVDAMMTTAGNARKRHSRGWYNNNFFDDGHHLRTLSRTTGRIIDLSDRATLYSPRRAIPKASRQIRGMTNLMLSQDFIPLIMPEKITMENYPADPMNPNPLQDYMDAMQEAKNIAKKTGYWMTEEWKKQELDIKLMLMVLLTMKNGISYMQVWPDAVEEAIRTQVRDAFDIYTMANITELKDSPFIIQASPKLINEIKANEYYDKAQLEKISPDNRYASDEIKEAYLANKFGRANDSGAVGSLILKEAYIKEYLNKYNQPRIKKQEDGEQILKDKEEGDMVLRKSTVAGNIWLKDEYVDLPDYPFVDFRMEPGPIYQVATIERFMTANKSLDAVVSRIERFIHTMNVGAYQRRRGENTKVSNVAGGLMLEYDTTPLRQLELASIPSHVFGFMDLQNSFIEEQGVTTSAMGRIPKGVKAWGAIESLKASEFSNLYMPIKMLKKTIKGISEKMLDIAGRYFINPQTVMRLDKGEPDYFDIIGYAGIEARKKISEAKNTTGMIPIKKDYKVEIEIESGLGYTDEGKKGRMMEIANFVVQLLPAGLVTPEAAKLVIERLMDIYKFGPTSEMMEALDGPLQGKQPFTPDQKEAMKIAMLEVIADLQKAQQGGQPMGQPTDQTAVQPIQGEQNATQTGVI